MEAVTTSKGSDEYGAFTEKALEYSANAGSLLFLGSIRTYASSVIFEQFFPSALNDTSTGDANGVVSAFPAMDWDVSTLPRSMHSGDSSPLVPDRSCLWTSW